jgi:diguanylate cyclase (GGDEF)-like protein/PAS domain S-box-containing protein
MASHFVPVPALPGARGRWPMFALGFGLALTGVLVVEILVALGMTPLGPVGWPSLGVILAAGLGGVAGLAGGALGLVGYYLVNLGFPERFPLFYSQAANTVTWCIAVGILSGAALLVRPRLLRLASAEAELIARRKYEVALLRSEEDLRLAKERLEMAIDGSNVVLWDTDLRTGRVYLSEAWARIVGAEEGATLTTVAELLTLVHPEDVDAVRRVSVQTLKGEGPGYAVEHRVRAANGEWHWVLSRGRVTERDADGRAVRMIGTNVDITDRKRIEEAVQTAAQSDPLTGLANRLLFNDRLRLALARCRRSGSDLAVLYLDLDRFKQVNDKFGHAAGDRLLKHVAHRLRSCVRQSDTVARLGGDEFVVLLEDLRDREHAVAVVEKIIDEMRAPLNLEGFQVPVTTSVGLAYAHGGVDGEALLKRADKALYEAKAAGRDCYSVA